MTNTPPAAPEEPSTPPAAPPAPSAGSAATPPAYSGAAPAYGSAPAGASSKRGLSLAGFIVGIASVILFWSSWFAILVGVVGLILSLIARGREPGAPSWMKILGLIFSIVGIVLGAIILIVVIAIAASVNTTSVG